MSLEFVVKVPVRIKADNAEEALDIAEKQYGRRPKKATVVESSLWPELLRPLVEKHCIHTRFGMPEWGMVDDEPWVTNNHFTTWARGAVFSGEPLMNFDSLVPRGKQNVEVARSSFRLHYQFGDAIVARRYVDFIEELHGTCKWMAFNAVDAVTAYHDDRLVGVVMPMSINPTVEDAERRLSSARDDATRAADVLQRATEILGAVESLPKLIEAEKDAANRRRVAERSASEALELATSQSKLDQANATIARYVAELTALGVTL